MSEQRRYYVHLPHGVKLELQLQPKCLGKDLIDHVIKHYKLQETEFFGICYKSTSGHYTWLQENKRMLDQDSFKKFTATVDFYFAVKFYVGSVDCLRHCLTVELFYLQLRSLVFEDYLEVQGDIAFRLAAYVLQMVHGDYERDDLASNNLRRLPVLSDRLLKKHPFQHCEKCILKLYKELKGWSKGKCILRYITLVETLPGYGMHYYKVKTKDGRPLWLGLSLKGIFQFELNNRNRPTKKYHWQQIENIFHREKKFCIEATDQLQRRSSADAKSLFAVEPRIKSRGEVKVYSWYGNTALIKTIWQMSVSQHKYFLDNQRKTYRKDFSSLSALANDLTNNNNTLIKTSPKMAVIKESGKNNKGKQESETVTKAKKEMIDALKLRRTELEDKLYDKVQELKKISLQQADIIGKIPPEYIRYMDLNEVAPKIKKRVGAEFKVKLRNKEGSSTDRKFPSSITVSSSASSGFGSLVVDPAEELAQLEQEFEVLTLIANAAKKLAIDSSSKGRVKKQRLKSFNKTFDKLQAVEDRINALKQKIGQQPSVRASRLITEDVEFLFEDGKFLNAGTESERSSLSEGIVLGDDTSTSSNDMLSNASINQLQSDPNERNKKLTSSSDVDISKTVEKRSLTPPPSFESITFRESGTLKREDDKNFLVPSPQSSSGISVDSSSTSHKMPSPRNWLRRKIGIQRLKPSSGWKESSLDSIATSSTASRRSEDIQSLDYELSGKNENACCPGSTFNEDEPDHAVAEKELIDRLAEQNRNYNNLKPSDVITTTPTLLPKPGVFEISSSPETNVKITVTSDAQSETLRSSPNISEPEHFYHLQPVRFRKRSSSYTDSSVSPSSDDQYDNSRSKSGTLKAVYQPQEITPSPVNTYNVQQSSMTSANLLLGSTGAMTKSKSSQELHPFSVENHVTSSSKGHIQSTSYLLPASLPVSSQQFLSARQFWQAQGPPGHEKATSSSHPHHTASQTVQNNFEVPSPPVGIITSHSSPYPLHSQYPTQASYLHPNPTPTLTSTQRDMLNNEVYQDINLMGWAPSLNEYSSRASVCESGSVLSKKEDIRKVLEDHLANNPGSYRSPQLEKHPSRLRRMREQFIALQEKRAFLNRAQSSTLDKTWADYQKQAVYSHSNERLNTTSDSVGATTTDGRRTPKLTSQITPNQAGRHQVVQPPTTANHGALQANCFNNEQASYYTNKKQHPNPTVQQLGNSVQHANNGMQVSGHTANHINRAGWHGSNEFDAKQRILLQHYLHHDRVNDPLDHVRMRHVHASANQKHDLIRHHRNPAEMTTDRILIAPSGNRVVKPQSHFWMARTSEQPNEKGVAGNWKLQQLSCDSTELPKEDAYFSESSMASVAPRGGISDSVSARFLKRLDLRCGTSSAVKSAPTTPNNRNRPFFIDSGDAEPPRLDDVDLYRTPKALLQNPRELSFSRSHSRNSYDGSDENSDLNCSLYESVHSRSSTPSFYVEPNASLGPEIPSTRLPIRRDGSPFLFKSHTLKLSHPNARPQSGYGLHFMDSSHMTSYSVHVPKSSSSSMVPDSSGGTLPRATNPQRKQNPVEKIPVSNVLLLGEPRKAPKKNMDFRRHSLIANCTSVSIACSPLPTTSKLKLVSPQEQGNSITRARHTRSRSEAWNAQQFHSLSCDVPGHCGMNGKPGSGRYTPVQEDHRANLTNSLRRGYKHSASADDILQSNLENNQAGTLV